MSDPLPFESATPRFALPLLFAGQAQKEFFVNEAFLRADLLLHCVVEGEVSSPPSSPSVGQSWLIGADPAAAFAQRENAIAAWTAGGWRFFAPHRGMRVFDRSLGVFRLFEAGEWQEPERVAAPQGGSTVDAEARSALTQLIGQLVDAGILPSG